MTARPCPECGVSFPIPTSGRNRKQRFCTVAHEKAFRNLMSARGRVAAPFWSTWANGRRGQADLTTYALRQLTALAAQWAAEDRAAGRDPSLVVNDKMRAGWVAADRVSPSCSV